MKSYSHKDLEAIRVQIAPTGSVCRVVTMQHVRGDLYTKTAVNYFNDREEGLAFALGNGSEVLMSNDYYGDMAFSDDGTSVRIFTFLGKHSAGAINGEIDDALRAQVEQELPTPPNGFETDELEDAHKAAHEKRFFELVNLLGNI